VSTTTLSELIRKKHELLVQLRDAGSRQQELIAAGDMTQLLKLLSSKQRLLNGLQELERQLDQFREQKPEQRSWPNEAERQRCSQTAAHCEGLLAEIVKQERESESRLMAHRDRVAVQLEGLHQAVEARRAYAEPVALDSCRLDLSSEN
jgi:flagellar FlgN protein